MSAPPAKGREIEARQVAINEVDDQVRVCLERRALLVVGVSAERALDAELALVRRFQLQAKSFDALFLAELERQMKNGRIQEGLVYDADAGGSSIGAILESDAEATFIDCGFYPGKGGRGMDGASFNGVAAAGPPGRMGAGAC